MKVLAVISPTKEWISEQVAMEMLSIKDKRTMRKKAIGNNINFTCDGSRNYKYLHKDLKNHLLKFSTMSL